MRIGKLVHLLRAGDDISQAALAKELGVSRSYLSQIENGRIEPSLEVLRGIASHFKIPVAVLLADEEQGGSELVTQLNKMLADALLLMIEGRDRRRRRSKPEEAA